MTHNNNECPYKGIIDEIKEWKKSWLDRYPLKGTTMDNQLKQILSKVE